MNPARSALLLGLSVLCFTALACTPEPPKPTPPESPAEQTVAKAEPPPEPEPQAPKMVMPVPLWENGETTREVDAAAANLHGYLIVDLGEAWTPYLFTDGEDEEGEPLPNAYRKTYLSLARGEYPDDHHGERARDDKYLELYGILPTLKLLRSYFHATDNLTCRDELDLKPLIDFQGLVTYTSNNAAKKAAGDFLYLRKTVERMMRKQGVDTPEQLSLAELEDDHDKDRLRRYRRQAPTWYAVDAAQRRLKCEGYFKGRGRYVKGALDWPTHDALAEFERRHRVYSWGYIGKDSLEVLRLNPMQAEQAGVLRVLTERAVHAAGILEDGSTSELKNGEPNSFEGLDGKQHPIPNLVGQIEENIIKAFGLDTPEKTLAWLDSLGELDADGHRLVAIHGPQLPEYYDGDMPLTLRYDRGDVWYDFPYDAQGRELAQPVQRRPRVTVFTMYNNQRIPLARFGTTIGGWRSEKVDETIMWKYKNSPVGPRVWERIVASPVWLPPDGTPDRSLLSRKRRRKPDEPKWEVNYHETGPSYASAYGLVAAYHRKFLRRESGVVVGGDEGIRTHGSVDYMSIMRRHSHGCHRLHNHIAVRLMSFVLAHRPHRRVGQQPVAFKKTIEHEEDVYEMDITKGGYIFELHEPLEVEVLEGRIRGKVEQPVEAIVPKFDDDYQAFVMPDGGAVELRGSQLVEVPMPVVDAGVPDGSVIDPTSTPTTGQLPLGATGAATTFTAPKPAAP